MKLDQPKRTVNIHKHAFMGSWGMGQAVGDVEAETTRMRSGETILEAPPCAGCGRVEAGFGWLTRETSLTADGGWCHPQPSRRNAISREGVLEESECPIVVKKPGNSGGAKGVTGPNNLSVRVCDVMRWVGPHQD
jgi:hypothetical protein